ncbi:uncharacterized protein [Diabrotica undecimpunctata]|uniref:uncharacterized protein n=1 Tax=Diabrotica undecimpunctata TaxID=50387 RepID=UPI003B6427FE
MEVNQEDNLLSNIKYKIEIELGESQENYEDIPDLVNNEFKIEKPDTFYPKTNTKDYENPNVYLNKLKTELLIEEVKSDRDNEDISLSHLQYLNYKQIIKDEKSDVSDNLQSEHGFLLEDEQNESSSKVTENMTYSSRKFIDNFYQCNVCLKQFTTALVLRNHMKWHTRNRSFQCNICLKKLPSSYLLKTHLHIHTTGEMAFKCEICPKQFSQTSNLNTHMRVHTREKPFKCKSCSKKFSHSSTLKEHSKLHTGEKPFNCEICSKRFAQKVNLNTHMRIHSGEKPFRCDICFKQFAQLSNLKRHLKMH